MKRLDKNALNFVAQPLLSYLTVVADLWKRSR